ncbi:DUF58 domain-containing protein [Natrarchaeobaculum sulfurireducens]|uniref:Uncharacterized protein n=1 Tax=Natrarchaeobaculum sulfurireducens TaxID=2044521 RepID=A0A346PAT7_9EURY|nr:DUF58 domain-containing protein [Natrarchaeobaculum sulfurireducens]AXR76632.1 hypothetical protein AArc1_0288 [Natrarchaeobaculum sulfurireducens]
MRPTIRGWTVVVVVAVALAMSWQYGPRSLNAVVVPLVVVLVGGVIATGLLTRPSVSRHPIEDGFPGDRRTVALTVDSDTSVAATVRDDVGDGLVTVDGEPCVETTLEDETRLEYAIDLDARGERTVGPLSITVTDVFGLVRRRFEYDATASVLVYPRLFDLGGETARELRTAVDDTVADERDEFDHLREYRRGDPRRDVHWKASAKRPGDDLVVAEHVADGSLGSITIAADGPPDRADELVSAVATVATVLFEANVGVGLAIGEEYRPPSTDAAHYRDCLALLAIVDDSDLEGSERQRADVVVRADETGTTVVVEGTELPVGRLAASASVAGGESDRTSNVDGTGVIA